MNKIYLIGHAKLPKFRSIEQLLVYAYAIAYSQGMCCETYHDIDCTLKQCKEARRSFSDLLCIVKTYFPSCTEKKLASIIFKKLIPKYYVTARFCLTVSKVVFRLHTLPEKKSNFQWIGGSQIQIGADGYSFISIQELANC